MNKESFEKDPLTGSRRKTVSVQFLPEMLDVIDQMAVNERRTRSNMIELLTHMGMVGYHSNRGPL